MGLAKDRTGRCAGVVDPEERADGGEETAEDRLKGLLTGIDERLPVLRRNSGGSPSFRNGEGVVRVRGLKLCPTTVSRMCVSEFQRGFGPGRSVGVFARAWLAAVPAIAREDEKSKRPDDGRDLRGTAVALRGTLEYRRLVGNAGFEAVPLTWRSFLPADVVVDLCPLLLRLKTTLEAGDVPGVSRFDCAKDASVRAERTVETESRSLREAVKSARMASMFAVTVSRSSTFARTSC